MTILNKEKILLGVLVLVLCFRVYKVVYPPEVEPYEIPAPPAGEIRDLTKIGLGEPPPMPALMERIPPTALVKSNPFTVYGSTVGSADPDRRPQLWFVGLRPWGEGEWRAEITTNPNARPKRYREGEEFESYRLERIDVENEEITVYSQEYGRSFTYKLIKG